MMAYPFRPQKENKISIKESKKETAHIIKKTHLNTTNTHPQRIKK